MACKTLQMVHLQDPLPLSMQHVHKAFEAQASCPESLKKQVHFDNNVGGMVSPTPSTCEHREAQQ